jgi:hypothetical protein
MMITLIIMKNNVKINERNSQKIIIINSLFKFLFLTHNVKILTDLLFPLCEKHCKISEGAQ